MNLQSIEPEETEVELDLCKGLRVDFGGPNIDFQNSPSVSFKAEDFQGLDDGIDEPRVHDLTPGVDGHPPGPVEVQ